MIALLSAMPSDGPTTKNRVRTSYLFHPKGLREWVVESIRNEATTVFGNLRERDMVHARDQLILLFEKVFTGYQILQMGEEPDRWVSIGFKREDPIPTWMKDRLLKR